MPRRTASALPELRDKWTKRKRRASTACNRSRTPSVPSVLPSLRNRNSIAGCDAREFLKPNRIEPVGFVVTRYDDDGSRHRTSLSDERRCWPGHGAGTAKVNLGKLLLPRFARSGKVNRRHMRQSSVAGHLLLRGVLRPRGNWGRIICRNRASGFCYHSQRRCSVQSEKPITKTAGAKRLATEELNAPIFELDDRHPAKRFLEAFIDCLANCVGRHHDWNGQTPIEQEWKSSIDGRVWTFSGFAHAFLSFDIVLDGFLENAPSLTSSETWAAKRLPLLRLMMNECATGAAKR